MFIIVVDDLGTKYSKFQHNYQTFVMHLKQGSWGSNLVTYMRLFKVFFHMLLLSFLVTDLKTNR
jgi:hypothetical protein